MNDEKNYMEIDGTVEHIVYTNSANGYTVAEIGTDHELLTATGIMPYLAEGEIVGWDETSELTDGQKVKVQ